MKSRRVTTAGSFTIGPDAASTSNEAPTDTWTTEDAKELYLIERWGNGYFDVNADGKHEVSEEIGRLREGDLFGEMSLIDDLLTSARVTTVGECRLLKMPRDRFEALLKSDDKLGVKVFKSFCRTLSDRLRRTTSMLAKTQALSVTVR